MLLKRAPDCYNRAVPGKKILVIDDDKAIHAAVKAVVAAAGHQVVSALDAMQGLMMVRQIKPDLVILDISMPAGGGYSVYERLQLMSGTFQVPILVYTAAPLDEVKTKIPPSGDVALLSKPASPGQLLEAVARFLPA